MTEEPYKASDDTSLFSNIFALHRYGIKPVYIESTGDILLDIHDDNELENTHAAYLSEHGICFVGCDSLHNKPEEDFNISCETLMQLAAMSACFAAGVAKARQEAEQKAARRKDPDND